jgi:hypothetical protein
VQFENGMSNGAEEDFTNGTSALAWRRDAAQRRWLRYLPAVAVALMLFRFRVRIFVAPLPLNDFMVYWAGAKLLLAHANPYSTAAITSIERSLGWTLSPHVLLNPPWSFPIFAWVGLFPFAVVHSVCRLLSLGVEAVCAVLLWRYFGGNRNLSWIPLVILATFLPAASAEQMGQITIPMLGALTVFLMMVRRRMYFAAGLALLVLAAKPHLVLLLFAAIVLWCIQERRWSLLGGTVVACVVSAAAVVGFDPGVLAWLHGSAQTAVEIQCGIGGLLRDVFGMQYGWLQFVPTVLGAVWFSMHWRRHRHAWKWEEQVPLLLLVSLVMAPYSWAHDFVLALPALIALAVKLYDSGSDWTIAAALYATTELVIFAYLQEAPKPWQSLACALWLVMYLVALPTAAPTEQPAHLLEQMA